MSNNGSKKVASGWFSACQLHALGLQASSRAFQCLTAWLLAARRKTCHAPTIWQCHLSVCHWRNCCMWNVLYPCSSCSCRMSGTKTWKCSCRTAATWPVTTLECHWLPAISRQWPWASLLTSHCNPLVVKSQIACTCCALAPKICWTHFLHIQARCVPFGLSIPLAWLGWLRIKKLGYSSTPSRWRSAWLQNTKPRWIL